MFQRTTPGKYFIHHPSSNYVLLIYRWIVYDLEFEESDGRKVSKIVFMLFSPDDNGNNQEKFLVACNKDALKSKISEVNATLQINRWDDLQFDSIKEQACR